MSEDLQQRPRTVTRLRAEAPPGLQLGPEGRKSIGRYEIIKTLGKGAMGVVYKAHDPLLDRTVAVKTISSPQGSGRRVRAAFIERFQREAKAAAKMQHPSIVTIFDVGVDEESGAPYMVLEYLPGESLADRLDRVRFPLQRAVNAGLELASALSFAHKQRIVHRDVKPANVLHAGENRWKLADFGIARMPDSDLTQAGIFMGTPGYSPPEAIKEGRYTPQADVFAWGAVLYELVCGRIPYEGPDTKTTNGFVLAGTAAPPSKHDSSIPEPIVRVIMTALESNAERRYKDGTEIEAAMRDAWDQCLNHALVHPSVLALDEVPHDRAPAQMHAPRGNVRPVAAAVAPPAVAPEKAPIRDAEPSRVDPRLGGFDEEATTILVREDKRPNASASKDKPRDLDRDAARERDSRDSLASMRAEKPRVAPPPAPHSAPSAPSQPPPMAVSVAPSRPTPPAAPPAMAAASGPRPEPTPVPRAAPTRSALVPTPPPTPSPLVAASGPTGEADRGEPAERSVRAEPTTPVAAAVTMPTPKSGGISVWLLLVIFLVIAAGTVLGLHFLHVITLPL